MGMIWIVTLLDETELTKLKSDPESVDDFINEAFQAENQFDLDKQWHGVHFLLTGSGSETRDPLSIIIGEFEDIGPDNGYGPAWIIPSSALISCHAKLSSISDADIAARFDPKAMQAEEVYLADTFLDEGEEARDFLMEDVARLREFIAKAASQSSHAIAAIV